MVISMRLIRLGDLLRVAAITGGMFVLLGTVAALWSNPFFMRMTPTSGFETGLLATQAVLAGLYLGISRPRCASKTAGVGGILGFLGVACPVCNKLLLWMFGSTLLLEYFEPVRIYVGVGGAALLACALWRKFFHPGVTCAGAPSPDPA